MCGNSSGLFPKVGGNSNSSLHKGGAIPTRRLASQMKALRFSPIKEVVCHETEKASTPNEYLSCPVARRLGGLNEVGRNGWVDDAFFQFLPAIDPTSGELRGKLGGNT